MEIEVDVPNSAEVLDSSALCRLLDLGELGMSSDGCEADPLDNDKAIASFACNVGTWNVEQHSPFAHHEYEFVRADDENTTLSSRANCIYDLAKLSITFEDRASLRLGRPDSSKHQMATFDRSCYVLIDNLPDVELGEPEAQPVVRHFDAYFAMASHIPRESARYLPRIVDPPLRFYTDEDWPICPCATCP